MTNTSDFRDALQKCSLVELRTKYLEVMQATKTIATVTNEDVDANPDRSRHTMEEQLIKVLPVEPLSKSYRKKLTRQIKSMGGVKVTSVESKAKRGASSFLYTCGFTDVGGKELLIEGVHRSSNKSHAALVNYMYRRHKEGHPLAEGHSLTNPNNGFVYLAWAPKSKVEATLLKATKMLEPTRLYGLSGYDILKLVPVGVRIAGAEDDEGVTREEALMLSAGFDVGCYKSLSRLGDGESIAKTLRMCGGCRKTDMELQKPLQKCTNCKRAFYCSKQCQQLDWKNHKKCCKLSKEEQWQNAFNLDPVGPNKGKSEFRP